MIDVYAGNGELDDRRHCRALKLGVDPAIGLVEDLLRGRVLLPACGRCRDEDALLLRVGEESRDAQHASWCDQESLAGPYDRASNAGAEGFATEGADVDVPAKREHGASPLVTDTADATALALVADCQPAIRVHMNPARTALTRPAELAGHTVIAVGVRHVAPQVPLRFDRRPEACC